MNMVGEGVVVGVSVPEIVCDIVPVTVPDPDADAPRESVAVVVAVVEAVAVGDAEGRTHAISTTAPAPPTPLLVPPTTVKALHATGKLAFTQELPPPPPDGKLALP